MGEDAGTERAASRCLEALATKQEELRRALGGRSLSVSVRYDGGAQVHLVFTRSGFVTAVPADQADEPAVELDGPAAEVSRFLRGRMGLGDAVLEGVVRLRMPEAHVAWYSDLRAVVAETLSALG